ncbi:TonB-dependent receptor plug [Bacteroides coprosuis DSM 18011]|uniref:TonB-dependent receptor plug n=1 Tax=Bacteroides coprosuis DSM 18011 TaxID=679937 RepID=F3ZT23_9BACE|nr:TonB-dependent receptor plug [Bacteroides coprosuis DSM 18011]
MLLNSNIRWLFLCVMILIPSALFAQNLKLTGTIVDDGGIPIIGASVLEKGTTNGTISDVDGQFTLDVGAQSTLVVSYIGYKTQEILVKGKSNINVTLKEDALMLDETIVIGYGSIKKSDMTGAISSVNVDELASRATVNPGEALQGKIAGVNIQKGNGLAGSGVSIKIRGVKTFGSNEPLCIIDGFPGDLNSVNPQDIESMEVLKDGAASAIYGSVAANGVIIVTTKNGKKGDVKIDFSTFLSVKKVAKQLKMLNASEYKSMHKQMYENWNAYAIATGKENEVVDFPTYINKESDVDTDWQGAMQRTGILQNYMVSVRGGSDHAQYSISYNRADEKGIYLGNNFRQDNARAKLRLSKYIFDIDANVAFKVTDFKNPQYSLKEMYMISPLVPIYDESREYGYGLTDFDQLPNNRNVMADHHYKDAWSKAYHTTANVGLTINITDWLNFKTSYAYRGEHSRSGTHTPPYVSDTRSPVKYPSSSSSTAYWDEQIFDNVLNFNKDFGRHSINAMLGSSITTEKYRWEGVSVEGKKTVYKVLEGELNSSDEPSGFLDPSFPTIDAGAGGTFSGEGSFWKYNRASFFGRINYNYADRYLAQITMRYDGSSKFGSDERWGSFPSVALGWRISEEAFFPKDIALNNLKLRFSWGRLGNENALGKYDFLALITSSNWLGLGYVKGNGANPWPASIATGLENRSLKWETTDTKNIGVDFGFFNNKLSGALNYYQNNTKDLLITKVLPPSAGLNSPILNVGEIENNGFEFELNWNDNIGDFNYNVGFNMFTTRNRVTSLADKGQVLYGEGLKYGEEHFPTQTKVGKPIGAFYLYEANGIFKSQDEVDAYVNADGKKIQSKAAPGDIRFRDVNGDGTINEDDKVYAGSGIPKVEANLNLGGSYKGFDFSVVLGSAFGHKIYNANKYFYEGMNSSSNFLHSSLNAWTPENPNTSVPRAIFQDPNGNLKESTRFLEKGDFLRLRQLQFGYTLPKALTMKAYIEHLRFYVSGENLFTITGYDGIDPEFSRGVLNTGIDRHIYPFTRSFTVGAQLSF